MVSDTTHTSSSSINAALTIVDRTQAGVAVGLGVKATVFSCTSPEGWHGGRRRSVGRSVGGGGGDGSDSGGRCCALQELSEPPFGCQA